MLQVSDRNVVLRIVSEETQWMLAQRMAKLQESLHETMSLTPFLMPILYDFHSAANFEDLGELLVVGHLMVRHFTSFGKLIDERILPKAFKTKKLTGTFRAANPPFKEACFNEIDHLIEGPDGPVLLSLKGSKWTIQLTAAIELNRAFQEILQRYNPPFSQIVVGVFAGRKEILTDKYDILRGINRGKKHNVTDLTRNVRVYAGREFWGWLNGGELATQEWVLDGILDGLRRAGCRSECAELLRGFTASFNALYAKHIKRDGSVDWHRLLKDVNG